MYQIFKFAVSYETFLSNQMLPTKEDVFHIIPPAAHMIIG